ncbi:MAG: hypothetical protein WBX81_02830, partial [Nitrososphaeraceae archaeon]
VYLLITFLIVRGSVLSTLRLGEEIQLNIRMQRSGTEDMLKRSYFTLWAFICPYVPPANAVRLHGPSSNFSSSIT